MQAGYGGEFFCCCWGGWEDCGARANGDIEDLFLVLVYVRADTSMYVSAFRGVESRIPVDNEVINETFEDGMGW